MIPLLNEFGAFAGRAGGLMFLQSAVLVGLLVLVELAFGRRIRPSLRCALWLLVVLKLLLPPSLSFPTGVGYWLGRWFPASIQVAPLARTTVTGSVGGVPMPAPEVAIDAINATAGQRLDSFGGMLVLWLAGSGGLTVWMVRRNRQVLEWVRGAEDATSGFLEPLQEVATRLGLRRTPELRLTRTRHSPAVYGLFNPVILLPESLARRLTREALRDVLLHELVHVRRRDLWLNLPQTLVQVIWWWNPCVWLANARIRVLREQAVDEQVMLLRENEGMTYPATLVEVARHCLERPVPALSFVGILESRRDLRSRVERLLNSPLPRRAGLGWSGWIAFVAAALLALPMTMARRMEAQPDIRPGGAVASQVSSEGAGRVSSSEAGATSAGTVNRSGGQGEILDQRTVAIDPNTGIATESPSEAEVPKLYTRTFRVNARSFVEGLESVVGGPGSLNSPANIQESIKEFIRAAGVNFPHLGHSPFNASPVADSKAIFFNDRTGVLFVRATLAFGRSFGFPIAPAAWPSRILGGHVHRHYQ
jgi:beta-lactamase regulating signal transducer with metallopeptidase domain